MRWLSFAVSVLLLAIGLVVFPAPPSPLGLAIFMLGLLLFLDCSWGSSIGYVAWGGLETRSKEIATDFYRLNNAKWRYLLASMIAGVNGAVAAAGTAEEVQVFVAFGSIALFVLYQLFDMYRCRKRVSEAS